MKAATGELNLTLITVVALGALLGLFTAFMWPNIKNKLNSAWKTQNTSIKLTYNFDENMDTMLF